MLGKKLDDLRVHFLGGMIACGFVLSPMLTQKGTLGWF